VFFELKQSKNVKFNYTYKGTDTFLFSDSKTDWWITLPRLSTNRCQCHSLWGKRWLPRSWIRGIPHPTAPQRSPRPRHLCKTRRTRFSSCACRWISRI